MSTCITQKEWTNKKYGFTKPTPMSTHIVKTAFPYEIKHVEPQINAQLLKDFKGESTGFVQVGPKKWFFPSGYVKEAENLYTFPLRPDDVFVATFPRSGTTITQEMVWLLCNDLDYDKASERILSDRVPFFEYSCFVHKNLKAELLQKNSSDPKKYQLIQNLDYPAWKTLDQSTERRLIKTHLPFSLLPPDLLKGACKVIYIARNPKDAAVSFYHLNRSMKTQGYRGDFKKYWFYFKNNLQPWTPYWEHIKEGWQMRNADNVLFMFYEDLNKNLRENIEKVATFLGKSYTEEELNILADHLKFENFKNNDSVNSIHLRNLGVMVKEEEQFVRKGKNGGWKDYFDEEMQRECDEWIEENLKNTDIRFPFLF